METKKISYYLQNLGPRLAPFACGEGMLCVVRGARCA